MRILTIITYTFLAIVCIVLDVLCKFLLNWLVVPFCDKNGDLPKYLKWFQTFDNNCDRGAFSRERDIKEGNITSTTWGMFWAFPVTCWQRYWNRGWWLFRNTAYGFSYYLFGMKFKPENWRCTKWIDTPDLKYQIHKDIVTGAFNLSYSGMLGTYKLGWKASNCYNRKTDSYPRQWGDELRIPITFSINPFKKRK